jgi:hypothetical protein
MTDQERQEFLQFIEEYRLRLKGNKELSKQFLIDAGIYTKEGVLAEPYENLYIPHPKKASLIV